MPSHFSIRDVSNYFPALAFSDRESRCGGRHALCTSLPMTSTSVLSLFSCRKFCDIRNVMLSMQSSRVELKEACIGKR